MPAETFWRRALERTALTTDQGQLIPLQTEPLEIGLDPFVVRRLLSRAPKHLSAAGPKPNPFSPWEQALEVARLHTRHVLLLNKYPVQPGHLLLITPNWQPQAGWLTLTDCQAVAEVSADTSGLWFFNSCAAAGASQPHRHLQLLPRATGQTRCPLEAAYLRVLDGSADAPVLPWAHALSRRHDHGDGAELLALVQDHCQRLGLGTTQDDPRPRHPYNLVFTDAWLLTVRRSQEHWHGFSVNGLGFAGYLLATEASELPHLQRAGPWALLRDVAATAVDP